MTGFVALVVVVVGAILVTLYLKRADPLSRLNRITLVVFVCAATVIIQADAYAQRSCRPSHPGHHPGVRQSR